MDQETTQTTTEAPVVASAPVVTPSEAAAPSGEQAPQEAQQYTPNFKFKVMDKEHEFDEFIRPTIKDKETEGKLRELYEKAYGLDFVKSERARIQEEYKSTRSEMDGFKKGLNTLSQYVKDGDLHSFFDALKIPEQQVLQYAISRANYQNLPQEEKMRYDSERQIRHRAYNAETQFQEMQDEVKNLKLQQRKADIQSTLSRPEVSSVQSAFDQRHGQGKFYEELVKRGNMIWATEGRDASPSELANELVQYYGFGIQSPEHAQAAQTNVPTKKPVIPAVGGGSSAPVQRSIKTIADLRKLAQELD